MRQDMPDAADWLYRHHQLCTGSIITLDLTRGPDTVLGWTGGPQYALFQSVYLQVETLGPWGGPGQRTSCGSPALAAPGRQGNMWTLAGNSWAGPCGPGTQFSITRAAR